MARYYRVTDNEWIQPVRRGYKMACCDCGLVHTVDFAVFKYGKNRTKVRLRAKRNERATALSRRQTNYPCKPVKKRR